MGPEVSGDKFERGMWVTLNTVGYKGRQATLDSPAPVAKDGTPRWYVKLAGTFTNLPFRVDEFTVNE
jgi:hypothetical protein